MHNDLDLSAGLGELRDLLRPDGADLELLGLVGRQVHLRLDLSNVECLDCVVPPELLADLVRDGLRRRVAPDLDVILDDPRR